MTDIDLVTALRERIEEMKRERAEFFARRDSERTAEPCDKGVCAAPAGHEGTCAEASGWED